MRLLREAGTDSRVADGVESQDEEDVLLEEHLERRERLDVLPALLGRARGETRRVRLGRLAELLAPPMLLPDRDEGAVDAASRYGAVADEASERLGEDEGEEDENDGAERKEEVENGSAEDADRQYRS